MYREFKYCTVNAIVFYLNFWWIVKIFPTNFHGFISTFHTVEAKAVKAIPTCGWNLVNLETFLSLNVCHLWYPNKWPYLVIASYNWLLWHVTITLHVLMSRLSNSCMYRLLVKCIHGIGTVCIIFVGIIKINQLIIAIG